MSDIHEPSPGEVADFSGVPAAPCTVLSLGGTKLTIESPRSFALGGALKVTSRNYLWMGEVWSCESSPTGFFIEIEVDARLNDVGSVTELAARFRHERTIRPGSGYAASSRRESGKEDE